MADKEPKSKAAEPPTPVRIGGESLADRIAPHIKKILVGVILIAVVLFVIFGIRAFRHHKDERRTAKLAKVLSVARTPVGPADGDVPGVSPPSNEPRFATAKERAQAVLDAIAKHGTEGSPTFHASLLLDAGKTDEAIAAFRASQALPEIDGVMAREGLGLALEAKAGEAADPAGRQKLLEDALAAFVAMQPNETGPRRAYALYHQGRLQLILGKRDEARALFEQAKELGGSTELPEMIDRRLATL